MKRCLYICMACLLRALHKKIKAIHLGLYPDHEFFVFLTKDELTNGQGVSMQTLKIM